MQRDNALYSAEASTLLPPRHFSLSNPFLLPESPTCFNFNSSYSRMFKSYSANSSPSGTAFIDGEADPCHHNSGSILEYQQLYNCYTLCLAELHEIIEEAEALRRENDNFRRSNADLTHRVSVLLSQDRLLSEFNGLNIASPSPATSRVVHIPSPQSFNHHNRIEGRSRERVSLPKSISVRSSGYLKINRPAQETTLQKTAAPESQRVYLPLSKKEEEALEFEVYNQGMFKTELCNKWQETGACPYGVNCQFAHGINELRPVIRHPRYKTEVCRMVLTGDNCPYGHRCHFRHSLTEQERLSAAASQH